MSSRSILVTDKYDRRYFSSLGDRVATGPALETTEMQAGLAAAFSRASESHPVPAKAGFNLRLDAFGAGHDVTRIAHVDPVMALVARTEGTGFSMDVPVGQATLSMSHAATGEGNALSVGAGLPFGEGHGISVSLGQARETDRLLGARAHGAFASLNSETVYGRARADLVLGKRVALNGSVTAGRTLFRGAGILSRGRADTRAVALGVSVADALATGDQLSLALARPFAVSGGKMTLRGGTSISASEASVRTNRVSYAETTVPLDKADRALEVHLGYLHSLETRRWDSAGLAFGGVTRLDGGVQVSAARIELRLDF